MVSRRNNRWGGTVWTPGEEGAGAEGWGKKDLGAVSYLQLRDRPRPSHTPGRHQWPPS